MLKKVMIRLCSRKGDMAKEMIDYMFPEDETFDALDEEDDNDDSPLEVSMEGKLRVQGGEVRLSYEETELTGMAGATTVVTFREDAPSLITMMRSGPVSTALVFEEKKRHICVYNTPYMPFELCVHTLRVDNRLLAEGKIFLDYIIEFRGAKTEHNLFELTVFDAPDHPKTLFS